MAVHVHTKNKLSASPSPPVPPDHRCCYCCFVPIVLCLLFVWSLEPNYGYTTISQHQHPYKDLTKFWSLGFDHILITFRTKIQLHFNNFLSKALNLEARLSQLPQSSLWIQRLACPSPPNASLRFRGSAAPTPQAQPLDLQVLLPQHTPKQVLSF